MKENVSGCFFSVHSVYQCQSVERIVTDDDNSICSGHELVRFQLEFDKHFN